MPLTQQLKIDEYKKNYTAEHFNLKTINFELSSLVKYKDIESIAVLLDVIFTFEEEKLTSIKHNIIDYTCFISYICRAYDNPKTSDYTKFQITAIINHTLSNKSFDELSAWQVVTLYGDIYTSGISFDFSLFDNLIDQTCKQVYDFEKLFESPKNFEIKFDSKVGSQERNHKIGFYIRDYLLSRLEYLLSSGSLKLIDDVGIGDRFRLNEIMGDELYSDYSEMVDNYTVKKQRYTRSYSPIAYHE